ncbi:phage tail tube protein [Chromatium okenii]|jgi:hypothetical protein|uniref:phage tail tube protein n=1 Tax=Chromatium okenii TaxID=61644 RepID=UPI0026EF3C62|nr:phage tail tube protein [Chromatium okenii]MBV5309308.1 hypothetical protein [Chromatium okenii]
MTIAQGVKKVVSYKKQTGLGVAASGSGGQELRRVTSTINLTKETFQSNEIRPDQQIADFRHGSKQSTGTLSGELSAGTYKDFLQSVLRRDFAAISSLTAAAVTIVASTGVITFQTGNPLTGGFKIGNVVRITAGSVNAANLNKNLLVTAVTATTLTVKTLNGSALADNATSITGVTVAATGKTTYVPETAQTQDYYTVEHWFSDVAQSEVYTDIMQTNAQVKIPANGMATIDFPLVGLNVTTGTSQVLTSPTAITTGGVTAGVNGLLLVAGTPVAIVTSIDFDINGNIAVADAVVGSLTRPDVFQGVVGATGTFSAYFTDATFRDYFINETEVSIIVALTTDSTATADFVVFTMSRVKVGGADVTDGASGLTRTFPFTALKNTAGGAAVANLATTIMVQDSLA